MFKLAHKDAPPNQTVYAYIKGQTGWDDAVASVGARFEPCLSIPNLSINATEVMKDVDDLYRRVEPIAWQSGESLKIYGLSLSYNPDNDPSTWKSGSFGDPRYKSLGKYAYHKKFSEDIQSSSGLKGEYLDSLGFRKTLPQVALYPHLDSLLKRFKQPVVRCSTRTLNGNLLYPTPPGDGALHVDDSPFEVLRINISLSNNGMFGLQYGDQEPIFTSAGDNLVINTDVKHRPFMTENCNFLRTNIIIGVTPWLDYDASKDEWSTNEYFGKIHPYDMVKQGAIFQ